MTLLCATHEVAIYIPPPPSSVIPPDSAMSICRRFIEGVAEGPAPDARVYDDRDASITIVEDGFFDKVEGKTPAFEALLADVRSERIRVLLLADPGALGRIPDHGGDVRRLDDQVEIVYAATRLAEVPHEDELEQLHQGDADTWRLRLFPLMGRRSKRRGSNEPPLVGAPRALVEALLARDSLSSWCRIANGAAPAALDDQGSVMQSQAARHFETWLRDGAVRVGLSSNDPEAAYWERIKRAHAHLAGGEWDGVTEQVRAAGALPRGEGVGTLEGRLLAAADFGRGNFAKGWSDFTVFALQEALFGTPWQPCEPVGFEVGLSNREAALRCVTFLLTRAPNGEDEELRDALDQLAAALPKDEARLLREATKPHDGGASKSNKAEGKKAQPKKAEGKAKPPRSATKRSPRSR